MGSEEGGEGRAEREVVMSEREEARSAWMAGSLRN